MENNDSIKEDENQVDTNTQNASAESQTEEKQTEQKEEKKKKIFSKSKGDKKTEKLTEQIKELQDKLDETNILLAETKDKHLRLFSEFDNFRKRTAKEKIELISIASSDLILKLLPVLDDIERAEKALEEAKDVEAVKTGCDLIFSKFKSILKTSGLEEVESTGKDFDTEEHDAIANFPAQSEDQKNKIIDTTEKGYKLNGKIIRHAKVVVGN